MNIPLFRNLLKVWLALFFLLSISYGTAVAQENIAAPPKDNQVPTYQSYAGLSELISMVCDDAINKLRGFFGPSLVEVRPFISFGPYQQNKISSLGLSLADQMAAEVNNDTILNADETVHEKKSDKEYQQSLHGSLHEVDGYLRIHMSAVNVYGERLSYTTSVEMSEPIYRSLHTYL